MQDRSKTGRQGSSRKENEKAIPAEMIQFKVKADNINGTGDLEVMVEC